MNEKELNRKKPMRGVSVTVPLIAMLTHLALPLDTHVFEENK